MTLVIRPSDPGDRQFIRNLMVKNWSGEIMITHGLVFHPLEEPALIAELEGQVAGVATFHVELGQCELLSLDALFPRQGIGSALLSAVEIAARRQCCREVMLVTTNDNLQALGFYQRRGYRIRAVRPGALDETRRLKPGIPPVAENGIPIRDEIELVKLI